MAAGKSERNSTAASAGSSNADLNIASCGRDVMSASGWGKPRASATVENHAPALSGTAAQRTLCGFASNPRRRVGF
jgi:hypothetical protein